MKVYRVGVIGSTGRGDYGHGIDISLLDVSRVSVVAVADDNPDGLKKAMSRLHIDAAFADYREMLEKAKPDIVAIGPRWLDRHAEMATAALSRGIHVYMEKPLCRTIDEADQILHASHMTHAKLALAHTTRYSPVLTRVRELIDGGTIGKVLEFRGRGKEDARGGGEDLWVLGSHLMNMVATLGGPPEWCFARVSQNGHAIKRSDVKEGNEGIGPLAGDDVRATYGLANGATATFQSVRNGAGNPSRFALQIYGTKGIIEIGTGYLPVAKLLTDSSWSPGRSGISWKSISSAGVEQPEPLASESTHAGNVAAMNDLIDAIEQNREPLCSAQEARLTIEMILAAFESQRTNAPVTFPLNIKGNPLTALS